MMVDNVRTKFGFVFQNLKFRCTAWDLVDWGVPSTNVGSRLLAFVLALLILMNAATHLQAGDAIDDYNVAVALFKQSRWNQAAEQFRGFLKDHEKHEKAPLARLYLGLTLIDRIPTSAKLVTGSANAATCWTICKRLVPS